MKITLIRIFFFIVVILVGMNYFSFAQDNQSEINDQLATTSLKAGSFVPDFMVTTLDGQKIKLSELKGKTIFLNFFALSCPICMKELPELENRIWQKYKDNKKIVIVCIGREETKETLKAFREKKKYTFPMAPDTDRSVYSNFGSKYIPRNILIDSEGKLVLTEVGFNEEKFQKILERVEIEINN